MVGDLVYLVAGSRDGAKSHGGGHRELQTKLEISGP